MTRLPTLLLALALGTTVALGCSDTAPMSGASGDTGAELVDGGEPDVDSADADPDSDDTRPDGGSDANPDAPDAEPDGGSDANPDASDAEPDGGVSGLIGGVGSSPSDAYPPTGAVTTADWWVHGQTGSDANAGTSRDDAFATLDHALDQVADGERIIVEGTLWPTGRVRLDGDRATGVQVFNYGQERWVLDFSELSDSRAVDLAGSGYHLKGVEIRNVPVDRGVDVTGHHNTLEDFAIHRVNAGTTGTGIQSYGASFNVFQDGLIYHLGDGTTVDTNTGDCLALTGSSGDLSGYSHDNYVVRVMCINGPDDGYDIYRGYDNYFIDSVAKDAGTYWHGGASSPGGDGFGFKMGGADGSGRNHFIGCIAIGNRNDGWHHNTATEACTIASSTAVSNGRWGFDVGGESSPNHAVTDSIAYDNADGPHYEATSSMVNNSWDLGIGDPRFYDHAGGDLSLAAGSAARGAARDGDHLGASRAALELLLTHWDVE